MNRDAMRLMREAELLAQKCFESPLAAELARFNAERAALAQGEPPTNDAPLPLPQTGVGGGA
jgi:hypothetical protein